MIGGASEEGEEDREEESKEEGTTLMEGSAAALGKVERGLEKKLRGGGEDLKKSSEPEEGEEREGEDLKKLSGA